MGATEPSVSVVVSKTTMIGASMVGVVKNFFNTCERLVTFRDAATCDTI